MGAEEIKTVIEKRISTLLEISILSDPSKATEEKRKIYLEKLLDYLSKVISDQKNK